MRVLIILLLACSSANAALSPPTNFRTDPADFSDVVGGASGWIAYQFRWQNNDPAQTGIQIEVSTNNSIYFVERIMPAAATAYDSANIPWTSNRWYRIKAISATDSSIYAGPIKGVGNMPPSNLDGSTADTTHMTVTWETAGGYLTGYTVQQDTSPAFSGGNFKEYGVSGQGSTSYTINFAFALNTIYYFRVVSTNSNAGTGNSDAMNKPISYLACAPNGPPVSPSFVTQNMDDSANEAQLFFDDVSFNTTGWILRYSINSGATWSTNSPAFTGATRYTVILTGLSGGSTYQYELYATNSMGLSTATAWTFNPPLTPAGSPTVWYVDKSAAGNNTGTNWANAWKSLGAINWSILGPGHIIYIAGGDYTNYLITFANGVFNNPILIKTATNSPQNTPVNVYGQVVWKSDYVTIDGSKSSIFDPATVIDITNNIGLHVYGFPTVDPDIFLYHCAGSVIKWAEATGAGNPSIGEGDSAGIRYADFNGPTNSEIAYCWVHDNFGNAILGNVNNGTGIGSGNIKIHHNLLERWHNNMIGGMGSSDFYNNYATGWKSPGVAHPDGFEGSIDYTRIYNNQLFNISPQSGNALNLSISSSGVVDHDLAIVNNVFATDTGFMQYIIGKSGTPDAVTISNVIVAGNVFWSGDNFANFAFSTGLSVTNWQLKSTLFANNIFWSGTNAGATAAFSSGVMWYYPSNLVFNYNNISGTAKSLYYRTNNVNEIDDVFLFPNAEAFNAWSTLYKSNSSATPFFVNPYLHDFTLFGVDTNVVKHGTNLSSLATFIPAITNDINGITRGINGGKWNVGPFEQDPSLLVYITGKSGYTNGRGSIAIDMSGNSHNALTITNRTVTDVGYTNYAPGTINGPLGPAFNFVLLGTNEQWQANHANLGYEIGNWFGITNWTAITPLTNGTWSIWVCNTNPPGWQDGTLWSAGWFDDYSWNMTGYNGDSHQLRFVVWTNNNDRGRIIFTEPTYSNWTHFAVTWDAINDVCVGYSNGMSVATNTLAAPYLKFANAAGENYVGIGGYTHGGAWGGLLNDGWFTGYLDELKLFNVTKTANQIAALYSVSTISDTGGGGGGGGGGNTPASSLSILGGSKVILNGKITIGQ